MRRLFFPLLLVWSVPCAAQTTNTKMIKVGDHFMRVRLAGTQRTGKVPTVVFESAFRERLESWDSIFTRVAEMAPAVAYDRAGNGDSELDGQLPTPQRVAQRLHALLAAVGAKPPYILVGHSWGGPLVRMYVALYPADVAGIVYVDPTDLRPHEEEIAYYREQGYVGDAMVERKKSLLRFGNPDVGETKVLIDAAQGNFKDFQALPPLPDVPMAVLMSASFGPASWKDSPCAPKKCEEVLMRWRLHWLRAMMDGVTNATLTVATGVGHYMQVDDPDLVLSAVRRVVMAAQQRRPKANRD